MARRNDMKENNFNVNSFITEDEMKAAKFSVEIEAPTIKNNIRDRSCIVQFPKGSSEFRLNRSIVETIMRREWGTLFEHVISFGNVDFSRRWVFAFDNLDNNDLAVAKEIYINNSRVKTTHATRKFNILKIDWVPLWTNLDNLAKIIKKVKGISVQR